MQNSKYLLMVLAIFGAFLWMGSPSQANAAVCKFEVGTSRGALMDLGFYESSHPVVGDEAEVRLNATGDGKYGDTVKLVTIKNSNFPGFLTGQEYKNPGWNGTAFHHVTQFIYSKNITLPSAGSYSITAEAEFFDLRKETCTTNITVFQYHLTMIGAFSASPVTVPVDGNSDFAWTATGESGFSCQGTCVSGGCGQNWIGPKPVRAGTYFDTDPYTVQGIHETSTFRLTCTGSGGTDSKDLTVNVDPSLSSVKINSITPNPVLLPNDNIYQVDVNWQGSGTCSSSGDFAPKAITGTGQSVTTKFDIPANTLPASQPSKSLTLTLTCSQNGQVKSDSKSVVVYGTPVISKFSVYKRGETDQSLNSYAIGATDSKEISLGFNGKHSYRTYSGSQNAYCSITSVTSGFFSGITTNQSLSANGENQIRDDVSVIATHGNSSTTGTIEMTCYGQTASPAVNNVKRTITVTLCPSGQAAVNNQCQSGGGGASLTLSASSPVALDPDPASGNESKTLALSWTNVPAGATSCTGSVQRKLEGAAVFSDITIPEWGAGLPVLSGGTGNRSVLLKDDDWKKERVAVYKFKITCGTAIAEKEVSVYGIPKIAKFKVGKYGMSQEQDAYAINLNDSTNNKIQFFYNARHAYGNVNVTSDIPRCTISNNNNGMIPNDVDYVSALLADGTEKTYTGDNQGIQVVTNAPGSATLTMTCSSSGDPDHASLTFPADVKTVTVRVCAAGETPQANGTCQAGGSFSCNPATIANATLCTGDGDNLSANTNSTVVASCAVNNIKCEFTCNSGYYASGNTCVALVDGTTCASPNSCETGTSCPAGRSSVSGTCAAGSVCCAPATPTGSTTPTLQISTATGNGSFTSYAERTSPATVSQLSNVDGVLPNNQANVKMIGTRTSSASGTQGQFFWKTVGTNGGWQAFSNLNSTADTTREATFSGNSIDGYWRSEYAGTWDIVFCVFNQGSTNKTQNCSNAFRMTACPSGQVVVNNACVSSSTPVAGVCGSSNGGIQFPASATNVTTNLCNPGTPNPTAPVFQADNRATWICAGLNNGASSGTCTAQRCATTGQTIVNGQCACPSGQGVSGNACVTPSGGGGSCTSPNSCEIGTSCPAGRSSVSGTCAAGSVCCAPVTILPTPVCSGPNVCRPTCNTNENAVAGSCPVIGGDQAQRCCQPASGTPSWCSVSITQTPNATVTLNQCTNGCTITVNKKSNDNSLIESLTKKCPSQSDKTLACSTEQEAVVSGIASNRTYKCADTIDSCKVLHAYSYTPAPGTETIQIDCPYDSTVPVMPTLTSFNATTPVTLGSKTKFYWNTSNATGCYISGNGKHYINLPASHTSDADGVRESDALQSLGNVNFTLTCCNSGDGGNNACAPNMSGVQYSQGMTKQVTVTNPDPQNVIFNTASSSIISGGDIVLNWDASSVSGASSCKIEGNGKTVAGNLPRTGLATRGSMTVTVPETLSAKTETYVFTCMGVSAKTLNVTVNPGAPTIDSFIVVSPINSGQKTTFKWETTNVIEPKCTINTVGGTKEYRILEADNLTGVQSDTLENTETADKTFTFRLSCSGAQGFSAATMDKNVIVHPVSGGGAIAPSITSFTADPISLNSGGKTRFTWASQNATKCSITGGGETYANLAAANSIGYESKTLTNTTPNEITVAFKLACEGANGTTPAESTASVKVKAGSPYSWWEFWKGPELNFYPSATSVYGEDGVQLSWYGKDLSGVCKASGSWSGTKAGGAAIQSETIKPLRQTSSFTLECAGVDGKIVTKTVVVKLKSPKIVTFKVVPKTVLKNEKTNLVFTWEARGVQSCKGSKNWGTKRGLSGTEQKKDIELSEIEKYKLECVAFDGKKVGKTITVQVVDPKSIQGALQSLKKLLSL